MELGKVSEKEQKQWVTCIILFFFFLQQSERLLICPLCSCVNTRYAFGSHNFNFFGIRELEFSWDLGNISETIDFHHSFGQSSPSKKTQQQQKKVDFGRHFHQKI